MDRSVRIHSYGNSRTEVITGQEALRQLGCQPSDECLISCKGLQKFMKSSLPVSAVDLYDDMAELVDGCSGPKSKLLGGVACSAKIK